MGAMMAGVVMAGADGRPYGGRYGVLMSQGNVWAVVGVTLAK
jgi:hypothetical protein